MGTTIIEKDDPPTITRVPVRYRLVALIVIVTAARTYSDVDGGAFTSLTATASTQKRNLDFDKLPRYLRMNYDIGGTNTPAFTVAVMALSATN